MQKRIAILGSTGSIGTQSLEVIDENPELFIVEVLTAYHNADLLIQQAVKFQPDCVVIGNKTKYKQVQDALAAHPIKVYAGNRAIADVVESSTIDVVITAMVGYAGLKPTINAIKAGKRIALANKETMVVAGSLINELVHQYKAEIIPVDSEHSAIFQCMVGEGLNPVEKIYLTASGGPFRNYKHEELKKVTRAQALNHPNWDMGAKITIDSASMMNKGLEVIEAKWLFDLKPEQIDVVVHPQSIVHSMVQFTDGSIKAQMGLPDMKLPIQYALTFPERVHTNFPRLDFMAYPELTFEKPDPKVFRNLDLAYQSMHKGGNLPCVLNAANEHAVAAFLKDKIGFLEMSDIIEETMQRVSFVENPIYEDFVESNKQACRISAELIGH